MSFVPPGPCPNCGEPVPRGARSCPECGSDEKSGWNDETYLDGIDLPEGEGEARHSADRFRERELGVAPRRGWKGWLTAAVLLALLFALLRLLVWR